MNVTLYQCIHAEKGPTATLKADDEGDIYLSFTLTPYDSDGLIQVVMNEQQFLAFARAVDNKRTLLAAAADDRREEAEREERELMETGADRCPPRE